MRKGQQQIRCNSDVSIADRIDSRLQIQGLPLQKTRGPRGQRPGQVPEMVMSGGDVAVHLHHGGDTGMPLQGKDVLHLLVDVDVALLLPHDVADLPLLLDAGLLPHLPAGDLHPSDVILPLSSVATAPHLCLHRRGGFLALPQNALLQGQSDALPGPPSAEVLLLKGGAHLLPPHLHPDTGEAPCCLLGGQAGIHDLLLQHPVASPRPLQTVVALLGVPPVLRDVLKPPVHPHVASGDSPPHTAVNPSVEFPAPRSHATTRDPLRAPS